MREKTREMIQEYEVLKMNCLRNSRALIFPVIKEAVWCAIIQTLQLDI